MKRTQCVQGLVFGIRILILISVVSFLSGQALPVVSAAEGDNSRKIEANLARNIVEGHGWPLGDVVTLSVDDPATTLSPDYMETDTSHVSSWDTNNILTEYDLNEKIDLGPGFVLTMTDNVVTKILIVANLQVNTVDPATYIVSGIAPAGMQVQVVASDKHNGRAIRYDIAEPDGHWSVNFSVAGTQWDEQTTVQGEGGGYVKVSDAENDTTHNEWNTIVIRTNIDDYWACVDNWSLGALLTMTISGPDLDYSDQAIVGYSPLMDDKNSAQTRAMFNLPVMPDLHLQAGDVISFTDGTVTKSYVVKPLRVTNIDVDADTISGIATPGSLVNIYSAPDSPTGLVARLVTADATGYWLANFHVPGTHPKETGTADLQPGVFGQAREYDDDGNETHVDWGTPAITAAPSNDWISGDWWPFGAPVTITIDNPNTEQMPDFTTTQAGGSFQYWSSYDFSAGDTITLTNEFTTKFLVVSDIQVTSIDVANDRITGNTTPNSKMWVFVNDPENTMVPIQSDGYGNWTADFSGKADLQAGSTGSIKVFDIDGDVTHADWPTPNPPNPPNPSITVHPDEDRIEGVEWTLDSILTIQVDDPNLPDYTTITTVNPADQDHDNQTWFNLNLANVFDLQPGQIVTVFDANTAKQTTIAPRSVTTVDPVADTITGITHPGIEYVIVWICDDSGCGARYKDVSPDGSWSVNFALLGEKDWENVVFDIQPDTNGGIYQRDFDGDGTVYQHWFLNQPPDTTPPTITWVGGISNGDSYYFAFVPFEPTCRADDLSGVDGPCTVSGYITTVGPHTLIATAKDYAGNIASETRSYTVLPWTIKGFYQPVDMNGVYNIVKNGSTVPLKFEIFAGSTELTDIAYIKSLTYAQTSCDATATTDEIETIATGGTSLRYDTTTGQFIYNWKTPSLAGNCYRVTMTTNDGSSLVAYFKLK